MIEKKNEIESKDDLVEFIELLVNELEINPNGWENCSLIDYLSAMAGWIEDYDGSCINKNQQPLREPSWDLFAQILNAASCYE